MFELHFQTLNTRRVVHRLQSGQSVSLGREKGDVRFPEDELMSSFHLTITASDRGVEFLDEGSTNGTFLNGQRVTSGVFFPHDQLVIGHTHINLKLAISNPPPIHAPTLAYASAPTARSAVRTSTGRPALRVEGSEATERRILPGEKLSVGRNEKSEWIFPSDDLMSGLHFVISEADGQWEVSDGQSLNGTFLNMERINRAVLKNGDTIAAGGSTFKVWYEQVESTVAESTSQFNVGSNEPIAYSKNIASAASDTQESVFDGKDAVFSYVWLSDLSGKSLSYCLKKGSEIGFSQTMADRSSTSLRIDWTGAKCRARIEGSQTDQFLINSGLSSESELGNGDLFQWGDLRFQVVYSDNAQTVPPPGSLELKSDQKHPIPAPRQDFVSKGTSDHHAVTGAQDKQLGLPPRVVAKPAVPAIEPGSSEPPISEPSIKAKASSSNLQPDEVQPDKVQPDEESSVITAELVTVAPKPSPSSTAARRNSSAHLCKSSLPSDDPIALLLGVSKGEKCWLVSVDPQHPEQLSVPTEISHQDPSWMLQVQTGWPTNFFMIVFANTAAEEVLVALLEQAPKPLSFTAANCAKWLQADDRVWSSTPIRSMILMDPASQSWCLVSGSPISEPLKKAMEGQGD